MEASSWHEQKLTWESARLRTTSSGFVHRQPFQDEKGLELLRIWLVTCRRARNKHMSARFSVMDCRLEGRRWWRRQRHDGIVDISFAERQRCHRRSISSVKGHKTFALEEASAPATTNPIFHLYSKPNTHSTRYVTCTWPPDLLTFYTLFFFPSKYWRLFTWTGLLLCVWLWMNTLTQNIVTKWWGGGFYGIKIHINILRWA